MQISGILQNYLDAMSGHVLRNDFDGYTTGVALPFSLVTCSKSLNVTSYAELRAGFDSFVQLLASQSVTDYIRLVRDAILLDERLISGHYTTHVMAGGARIMAPFPSQIVLRHDDGPGWRAVSIANGIKNARWPLHTLQVDVPANPQPTQSGKVDLSWPN